MLLREFLRGDFIGALAEPAPEDADVVAVEDVRTAVFGASDFLALSTPIAACGWSSRACC